MAVPFCTSTGLVLCKLFEGIWNNYVHIEQKIMQFRFIISLCTLGYISLGLAARNLKENMSKYKLIPTTLDSDHARRTKWSQFLLILCFSTLTNYWKHFLTSQNNFTSSTIRKWMHVVYTGQLHLVIHSIDIIFTCYVYENRRKWFRSRTCENAAAAGRFEIDDLHLQIIESISSKASVENSSAQWAIFNPGKDSKYYVTSENWEVGFALLYQAFGTIDYFCQISL